VFLSQNLYAANEFGNLFKQLFIAKFAYHSQMMACSLTVVIRTGTLNWQNIAIQRVNAGVAGI